MPRVLVVDDHASNRYLLRTLLEGHAYVVDEAVHGAEALIRARQHPPDLIISDLLMPVLDGYALLRHWRNDEHLRRIPFLVYTATYTEPREERLAMALGADAFIIKPAEPEVLMARIRHVLAAKERGELPSASERVLDEHVLLKEYNDVLVHKLERKAIESEEINRELWDEIGERKRAVEQLRDSEERFRATFEQAPVGIAHVGLDGRFLWVNDKLCEMTGYSADELQHLTAGELTAAEDRTEGETASAEMLAGARAAFSAARRYQRKGGGVFWVNVVTTLLRDRAGAPRYFITVIVDITDLRRTEEALVLRDRAIQQVTQGILITDPRQPDNPIIYASGGFERITGYTPAEVLGRNCRFLQGKDTDQHTVAQVREAICEERALVAEILNYRKDGTPFWNGLSINPVRDGTGAVELFVGVQNDVTGRKTLEAQLRQAHKMEAVGRLAGGVAHDFNNLLTVISGYSELLLAEGATNEPDREAVAAIREACGRATALTRQLLGFSRQTMLQPKVLDLNVLIADMGKMLERLIGADVRLTTVLDAAAGRVRVDPGQLDQVLMNLVVNARDAMPTGGDLTIETANVLLSDDYVAVHVDAKPGPHVLLSVTDTGCGMAPDVLARIFEPFYTTKSVDKGTGLGLPMVFGIVQQSGGHIDVDSEPDHGTTFRLYFPAVAEPASTISHESPTAILRGTETILLVEDEAGVRALASMSLELYGSTVLPALDGNDALRVLQDHRGPVDLVLTDVVMPNLGGLELAKALRARFPQLKVLYMSGFTDDTTVRHGLLDAEMAFIQKPYTSVGLAQKVRQVLDRSESTPG